MIDHLTLPVTNYDRSKAFYLAALACIDYATVMEFAPGEVPGMNEKAGGFGPGHKPYLWLRETSVVTPTHVAFTASTRSQVDAFHRAALEAGARDHGAPGIREHYHANYYGAFVIDPDGYNLEVVCHDPE